MNASRFRNASLNLALIATVAAPLAMGASTGLMLTAAKSVSVNHANGVVGAALKAGDVLQTNGTGGAVVRVGAANLTLGHLTKAVVETAAIRLNAGYVRVNGPLTILQGKVAVVPAAKADYEVVSLPTGKNYVRVYSGSVSLRGLANPTTVGANEAVEYDTPNAAAPAPAGGSGSPVSVPVALGIIAGATTALAVIGTQITSNKATASPSQF